MLYDYSGFATEAYQIHTQLAHRIKSLLGEHGLPAKLDSTRGNDHGTFIPMKLMFPEAKIPTVQMSLYDTLDPDQHIKMGEVLSSLRDDNILVIGSGLSYHSFKHFFGDKVEANRVSEPFNEFLVDALVHTTDPSERRREMNQWLQAPFAREVHPREEHLMSLFVATGARLHEPCEEFTRAWCWISAHLVSSLVASSLQFLLQLTVKHEPPSARTALMSPSILD